MDVMTLLERYGLATLIVLYLLVRFIPQMFQAFRDELAKERLRADKRDADAAADRDKDRALYAAQVKAEREQCQANHLMQMDAHTETRHAVNEWANLAGLKKAVGDLEQKKRDEGRA